jgi:hypothetical protein
MTSLLCAVAQLKAITGEDRIAWAERYHVAISACERHHRKAAFAARRRRRPCATLVTGEPPSDNLRDDGDGDLQEECSTPGGIETVIRRSPTTSA